ncbi:MAG: S1 RNA-binding domain-containing protein [Romboutsia sp.]|nr:S1 RNA-binding domain-containing protein [Romboutsia sp.]
MNNTTNNLDFYRQALESKKILKGKAKISRYDEKLDKEILILNLKNTTGIIHIDEIDVEKEWDRLNGFIGRELIFVVTEVHDDYVICSRKKAQEMLMDDVLERLKSGEVFSAKVINPQKYGAYIEIEGVLTGILKNLDFAENHITVKEVLQKGDIVNVRLKKITNNGKLNFEAVTKYKSSSSIDFSSFKIDDIVEGKLKTIQPDKCFVNIAPGLDALCSIPTIGDLYEDMNVIIKISKLDEVSRKIRGKIIEIKRPKEY